MSEGPMRIELLLFAQLAEAAGAARLVLDAPPGATVESVWSLLGQAAPQAAAAASAWRGRVALAHNERYARGDELLADGDVVAMIPPVSGG